MVIPSSYSQLEFFFYLNYFGFSFNLIVLKRVNFLCALPVLLPCNQT